jgi:hypothetical protein
MRAIADIATDDLQEAEALSRGQRQRDRVR